MGPDDFEDSLAAKPRDEKWELIGGRVVRMTTGARWERHFIVQNLNLRLGNGLLAKGSPCRVFAETFRMKEKALDSSVMPDLMVRCGPLVRGATSLDDPTVLIEVLSDGSVGRDRVEKWRIYQKLASLQHYVLVERDKPVIEVFDRAGEAWFEQLLIEGLDVTLDLSALDLSIPLADIYRDVLKP